MEHEILKPVVVLVLWTLVMLCWLYATRIPAMIKLKMRYDSALPNSDFTSKFPPGVRWKADNYDHLLQQPTLFYAVALLIAVTGTQAPIDVMLAWVYVGLRILHSLAQALRNRVSERFFLFALSSIALVALSIHAAVLVF